MSDRSGPPTLLEAATGVACGSALFLVGIVAMAGLRIADGERAISPLFFLVAIGTQSFAAAGALLPLLLRRGGTSFAALAIRGPGRRRDYLWIVAAVVVALLAGWLILALQSATGRPVRPPGSAMLADIAGQPWGLPVLVLGAVVLAPIGEELVFRGLIFGCLRALLPAAPAIALQAIPFGLLHGGLEWSLYACALGCVLGLARERTNSLNVCILAHMAVNALALLPAYLDTAGAPSGAVLP